MRCYNPNALSIRQDQSLQFVIEDYFYFYLKEIADVSGSNKRLTHHVARKTFASTVLLYNDAPMEIVSELLCHSNKLITQESYGKVVQKKVSEAMNKLKLRIK